MHLLTKEAFEIYDRQLKRDGVLAVHVSSAHLDLEPVVRGLARHLRMQALCIRSLEDGSRGEAAAAWMLLSRNREFLANDAIRRAASTSGSAEAGEPAWTDDYANVLGALDLRVN